MAERRDLTHGARCVDGAGQQHTNIVGDENVTADDPSAATRDAAGGATRVFGDTELTDTAQRLRRTSGADAHVDRGHDAVRTKSDDESDEMPLA